MQRYRAYGASSGEEEEEFQGTQEALETQEEEPVVHLEAMDDDLCQTDGKPSPPPPSSESKSVGKPPGGAAGTAVKYSLFTWFAVLALLGVWSSVAVVYFDIVDYDGVMARARDFRANFTQVLQGKLSAYDADGDGDFDAEDAKVLLGLKEEPAPPKTPEEKAETHGKQATDGGAAQRSQGEESAGTTEDSTTMSDAESDLDSEIQAAVPLPAFVEEDFVADDPREEVEHLQARDADAIDTSGVSVEAESSSRSSVVESAREVTSSKLTREQESQMEVERPSEAETGSAASQTTAEKRSEAVEAQTKTPKKKKAKLLNKLDRSIKADLDAAEKLRKKGKLEAALKSFEALVRQHPLSPRARYGQAQAEDDLAEKRRSNDMLLKAVASYRDAAELPDAAPDLVRAALARRAERQQFLGRTRGAVTTLERLVQIFPDDVSPKNDLGVAFLLLGDNKSAKKVYEEVLAAAPANGFAKVHYGFILKSENKIAESIPYLKEGLESGEPGTDDGRFYFHLGDALQRMGDQSAYHWYRLGHERGHFASVWQRSLYNVDGLKAQPWWTPEETGYTLLVEALERNWESIRDEALAVMDRQTGHFVPEEENLREKGEWGQYTLWQQGKKSSTSCQAVPKTCALLEKFPEATGCKRGQIKFSAMQPGTHVWPHTGPTNCRLRMHLGLVVPREGCRIRCTDSSRTWEEGKVLIFDDSFEHEVWQDAASFRLVFIVDVWHPQLTAQQRRTLGAI
ncbi:aspartyl/asparaginyl beta-hydroxylase isoform X1 [Stigmatopora argus]